MRRRIEAEVFVIDVADDLVRLRRVLARLDDCIAFLVLRDEAVRADVAIDLDIAAAEADSVVIALLLVIRLARAEDDVVEVALARIIFALGVHDRFRRRIDIERLEAIPEELHEVRRHLLVQDDAHAVRARAIDRIRLVMRLVSERRRIGSRRAFCDVRDERAHLVVAAERILDCRHRIRLRLAVRFHVGAGKDGRVRCVLQALLLQIDIACVDGQSRARQDERQGERREEQDGTALLFEIRTNVHVPRFFPQINE